MSSLSSSQRVGKYPPTPLLILLPPSGILCPAALRKEHCSMKCLRSYKCNPPVKEALLYPLSLTHSVRTSLTIWKHVGQLFAIRRTMLVQKLLLTLNICILLGYFVRKGFRQGGKATRRGWLNIKLFSGKHAQKSLNPLAVLIFYYSADFAVYKACGRANI